MSGDQRPETRYCSACGAECSPSANYCWSCGTSTDAGLPTSETPADAGSPTSEDRSQRRGSTSPPRDTPPLPADGRARDRADLERQIAMAAEEGWELEHDFGDRAVLVRRQFGSMSGHILVGLFTFWWTMGVGNVLYGVYRYFGDVDQLVLQTDSTDERVQRVVESTDVTDGASTLSRRTAGVYWLLAVALFAAGTLVSSTMVTGAFVVLAVLATVAGVATLPSVQNRIDRRYPLTTMGQVRSVDERTLADPDQPCSACAEPVDPGIERTYYSDQCLFGLPVSTAAGENYYCKACANGEQMAASKAADESSDRADTEAVPDGETADSEPSAQPAGVDEAVD